MVRVPPRRSNSWSWRTRSSLGCKLQRNFANLVEEQSALVRQFDAADFLADGPGKRALLVAEQLALEQSGGDRGTIELDEIAVFAAAHAVNGARDPFFSGAGFAGDQHDGIGVGDDGRVAEYAF